MASPRTHRRGSTPSTRRYTQIRTASSDRAAPRRHVWECTPLVSKADEEERYKSLKAAAKLAKNPATFWTFALKNRMSARGVPLSRLRE